MADILTEIYSAFEPSEPPEPSAYVDYESVRGGWSAHRELGNRIVRSKQPTCQLYTGHRGVGKSTELLQLKKHLEKKQYFVVYFAAEEDIEPQDTEYADILLACTRRLVSSYKLEVGYNPLLQWMKDRWQSLKELALTEVEFDTLTLEQQISQFAKISANLRAVPDIRAKVRQQVNDNTVSLVKALNEFIKVAKKELEKEKYAGLVVIADSLDRTVEKITDGQNNHDEIFLNRSEQLKGLECHVIYTVPISMVLSSRATKFDDNYESKPDVLPMVMVRNLDDSVNVEGMQKFRETIAKRIKIVDPKLATSLDKEVFEGSEILERLCIMSGGHVRNLMQMIQTAIDWTDKLPISQRAVQRAISEARNTYAEAINDSEWKSLAKVFKTKKILNDDIHRLLLGKRCIYEYRYLDADDELKSWYDIHPLIRALDGFKIALEELENHGDSNN
ncbi:ATP-binding protein [Pseudanabaena sp. PCC 6802]|uniref:ATP-binding protein n=1 Tax=Pseudanabaena sp. PCC 6802 TaxID=118173 RepID=UPI0003463827|nr:ATP-binding protein [Pseudanabaena sp. PCC 6802]